MKLSPRSRRIALIAFIIALLAMLAVGFYLAATHQEARPVTTSTAQASSQTRACTVRLKSWRLKSRDDAT